MAAAAIIGDNNKPKKGYKTPAIVQRVSVLKVAKEPHVLHT